MHTFTPQELRHMARRHREEPRLVMDAFQCCLVGEVAQLRTLGKVVTREEIFAHPDCAPIADLGRSLWMELKRVPGAGRPLIGAILALTSDQQMSDRFPATLEAEAMRLEMDPEDPGDPPGEDPPTAAVEQLIQDTVLMPELVGA